MKIFRNKRGLSPLIATILLIAFAVALGAVIMNLGRSLSMDAGFSILEMNGAKQICYFDRGENSVLQMTIQNGDVMEIVDLKVSIVGTTNEIINKDGLLTESIKKTELQRVIVTYDSGKMGELKKIIITPNIIRNGEKTLGTGLEIEGITPCQAS